MLVDSSYKVSDDGRSLYKTKHDEHNPPERTIQRQTSYDSHCTTRPSTLRHDDRLYHARATLTLSVVGNDQRPGPFPISDAIRCNSWNGTKRHIYFTFLPKTTIISRACLLVAGGPGKRIHIFYPNRQNVHPTVFSSYMIPCSVRK